VTGVQTCALPISAIFAPKIFKAQLDQALETRLVDLWPIVTTLVKVLSGFIIFGTGNPLVWFGSYWVYNKYKAASDAAELRALEEKEKKQK
jgi:hypothetical protein